MHLNLKVKGKPQHIEVYILIFSFRMQSRIHAILLEALAVAPRANSVAAEIEAENFTRESKRSITSTISMRVSQIDIRGSLLSLSVFSTFVHIPQNITVSAHGPCVCTTHTGAYPPAPPPPSLSLVLSPLWRTFACTAPHPWASLQNLVTECVCLSFSSSYLR